MSQQLIDIEDMPNGGKLEYVRKRGQIYIAVGPRSSDGFTVLKIRSPGASKNHNIEVGAVYAVTVGGRRHVLETPNGRWKLRAQELRHLLGEPIEDWAVEYFNSASPKYFKRASDYVPEIDASLEAAFRDPTRTRAVPDFRSSGVSVGTVSLDLPGTDGHCQVLAAQASAPGHLENLSRGRRIVYGTIGFLACAIPALIVIGVIASLF